VALVMLLSACPQAWSQNAAAVPSPGQNGTEKWVWEEIRAGREANLDHYCGSIEQPAPADNQDPRWNAECRRISAAFVERALLTEPWGKAIARQGFRVSGANVEGMLDLEDARIDSQVSITRSRFNRTLVLADARLERGLNFTASVFEQDISAHG